MRFGSKLIPRMEDLANAQLILPLSPQGQMFYDEIRERLVNAPP